jgi:low temperature requirement protein LtrA
MVERYGCALLITLGESVVAVGIGVSGTPVSPLVVGEVVLGLALAAAAWWAYFGGEDERAERALTDARPEERGWLTIAGYFYATIPMVIGVVAMAAGVKKGIAHAGQPLNVATALALAGGVALFLAGAALLRRALRIGPGRVRAGGALLALATIPLGTGLGAAPELIALVSVFAGTLAVERRLSL